MNDQTDNQTNIHKKNEQNNLEVCAWTRLLATDGNSYLAGSGNLVRMKD